MLGALVLAEEAARLERLRGHGRWDSARFSNSPAKATPRWRSCSAAAPRHAIAPSLHLRDGAPDVPVWLFSTAAAAARDRGALRTRVRPAAARWRCCSQAQRQRVAALGRAERRAVDRRSFRLAAEARAVPDSAGPRAAAQRERRFLRGLARAASRSTSDGARAMRVSALWNGAREIAHTRRRLAPHGGARRSSWSA